jgi:cytochrome c oxidase subunit II
MIKGLRGFSLGTVMGLIAAALIAVPLALAGTGQPSPWQYEMQTPVSDVALQTQGFHHIVNIVIILIALFVLGLMLYVMWKFNERANPTPSRTTHNTLVEVLWTVIPVLILVVIAIPSFKLLYFMDRAHEPEMTLKAIGNQWYWSYEYPDNGDIAFSAYMVADADLQEGQPRLLTTDAAVVLPVQTDIRVLITATDVLHSWAVPAFGVKTDAVPGRINETWLRIEEPGMYYGQCSELCGDLHGFMPIMVRAVSKEEFDAWTQQQAQAERTGVELAGRERQGGEQQN